MTEKFNKSKLYRQFVEAAKRRDSIPLKDDRKSAARDPDFLLHRGSERLRQAVPLGVFASFFKVLQGDHKIDPRALLKIGNFLYGHRSDRKNTEGEKNPPLSSEDRPLVNLACALIEDAFYRGNLLGLPKEHGASFAFTINVIAKILERESRNATLTGFNRQKLGRFLNAVIEFEKRFHDRVIQSEGNRSEENRLHHYFLTGARRGDTFLKEKYTSAYLIKNALIVDNRLSSISERERRAEEEDNLRNKYFKDIDASNGLSQNRTLMYSMLTHKITEFMPSNGSSYADLHFLEEDIPFAVWALRYLRSLKKSRRNERG